MDWQHLYCLICRMFARILGYHKVGEGSHKLLANNHIGNSMPKQQSDKLSQNNHQRQNINKQILIRSCITAINNTVCVVALVAVYLAEEIEFEERAIYGMASVVVWLAVQRIVGRVFPRP